MQRVSRGVLGIVDRGPSPGMRDTGNHPRGRGTMTGLPEDVGRRVPRTFSRDAGHWGPSPGTGYGAPGSLRDVGHRVPSIFPRDGASSTFGDAGHPEQSPGTGHDAPDSLQGVGHHVPRTVTRVLGSRDLPWGQDMMPCALPRIQGSRDLRQRQGIIPWGPSPGRRGEGTFLGDMPFARCPQGHHQCRGCDTGDAPWGRDTVHRVPYGVSGSA